METLPLNLAHDPRCSAFIAAVENARDAHQDRTITELNDWADDYIIGELTVCDGAGCAK